MSHLFPHILAMAALLGTVAAVGCSSPQVESPAPLPTAIELRTFEVDLLEVAQPLPGDVPGEGGQRARVEIPADGTLELIGRAARREGLGPLGPVRFSVRIDGEERFAEVVEGSLPQMDARAEIPLADFAGREVEIDLGIDESQADDQTRAFWHRAVVHRSASVERLEAGQGRNLLFVVVDTLRADRMSLYGHTRTTTPHLDSLADTSLVFDNAIAPAPWTLPSTTSLLTGQPPPEHGVVEPGHFLPQRFSTLAERFATAGITTFGVSANPLIGPDLGFDQGFETFHHLPWNRAREINDSFLDWLDGAQEHRWFAYLHYIDPHDPYDAPPPGNRWVDEDYDGAFTDPALLNQLALTLNWDLKPPVEIDEHDVQHLRNQYDGELLYWDLHFWRLLNALEARGLLDETILIVTSDHGEELFEHGKVKHGFLFFDESVHVPLLIRAPGRIEPGRHAARVSNQGVFRAALQLSGLSSESSPDDLLRRPEEVPVFSHSRIYYTPDKRQRLYTTAGVREGSSLFVRSADVGREELFDLTAPADQILGQADTESAEIRRLRALLDAWLATEASGDKDSPPPVLDPETLERLRALGYIR